MKKKMTGMAIVAAADYLLDLVPGILPDDWETQVDAFLAQSEIRILKQTKRSEKEVDIKPLIYRMEVQDHKLFMQLAAGSVENLKPGHGSILPVFRCRCHTIKICTVPSGNVC